MKRAITIILVLLIFISCKKSYEVIVPDVSTWDLFKNPSAITLKKATRDAMQGVYGLNRGMDEFGEFVAIKWSHIIKGSDTTFHVSGFFGADIAYFICEGKQLRDSILLNGYWRKMVSTETGIMRLTINTANGANLLLNSNPVIDSGKVTMNGVFGKGQETPQLPITFTYHRKLYKKPSGFHILAHRAGGRTSDLLPFSENSVEMILKSAEFGSTGVEIDVRFTKDSVPILYHDEALNLRLVQKSGLIGKIENYTYDQLTTFVRLIKGEKIPTLREALNAVVFQTDLTFVWLDTKYIGSLAQVRALQQEFMQKAAARGRTLQIVIGLPAREQFFKFLQLPDYLNTPSLCELTLEDAQVANARVWAPRFTEGTQNDKVAIAHSQGRLAFSWTIDAPEFVTKFINEGNFDGLLSNYPSIVAYNYYVQR